MEEKMHDFYKEISKKKRREILDDILMMNEKNDEFIRIMEYIWKIRFKKDEEDEDCFQNALLELLQMDEQLKIGKNINGCQQHIFHLGQMLGLDDYRFQTGQGKRCFVSEYENLAGCFIELRWSGKTDKNYIAKIKNEIKTISVILPEKFGLAGLYRPLAEGMNRKLIELYSEEIE